MTNKVPTGFAAGTRLRLLPRELRGEGFSMSAPDGTMATVVGTLASPGLVKVSWDMHEAAFPQMDGEYFISSFEVVTDEDASNVDELIHRYATRLRKAVDEGTLVAPYSEIGIFASFLMDYKRISK